VNAKSKKIIAAITKDTGLKLWTDAYDQYRQIIMGPEQKALYEREKRTEDFKSRTGATIHVSAWGPWSKVREEDGYVGKAYYIRDLTIEDLILGNHKK
jgi:hypothetical protein